MAGDRGPDRRQSARGDRFLLAGDIGGTKTSLAVFSGVPPRFRREFAATYPSASAQTLAALIDRFLAENREMMAEPAIESAAFGIAAAVTGPRVSGVNLPWPVDAEELKKRYGWSRVTLMNDLVAMAMAIPLLDDHQKRLLFPGDGTASGGNIALIAAGTGLGEALLVQQGSRYLPVPSEGGHKDFAPRTETQMALYRYLAARHQHVSLERVVSGRGLAAIHDFLRQRQSAPLPSWLAEELAESKDPAAVVSAAALANRDPVCVAALELFVAVLGAAAGNLALQGVTTGGVYLGGGICPKILPFLETENFRQNFLAKGRMRPLLEKMAVAVLPDPSIALQGALVQSELAAQEL